MKMDFEKSECFSLSNFTFFRLLCDKKKALLEERQRILDGEDEVMLDEVRAINEQMQEQKQMLISRMEV
jgi:hypothetical protein